MQVLWHENGWDDYIWWLSQNKSTGTVLWVSNRVCGIAHRAVPLCFLGPDQIDRFQLLFPKRNLRTSMIF